MNISFWLSFHCRGSRDLVIWIRIWWKRFAGQGWWFSEITWSMIDQSDSDSDSCDYYYLVSDYPDYDYDYDYYYFHDQWLIICSVSVGQYLIYLVLSPYRNALHCALPLYWREIRDGWQSTCWSWVSPTLKDRRSMWQRPSLARAERPTSPCCSPPSLDGRLEKFFFYKVICILRNGINVYIPISYHPYL